MDKYISDNSLSREPFRVLAFCPHKILSHINRVCFCTGELDSILTHLSNNFSTKILSKYLNPENFIFMCDKFDYQHPSLPFLANSPTEKIARIVLKNFIFNTKSVRYVDCYVLTSYMCFMENGKKYDVALNRFGLKKFASGKNRYDTLVRIFPEDVMEF